MADGAVFDATADALESLSTLDRLEARGTVRLALKEAGLDSAAVTVEQMVVVLERLLPGELEKRGIAAGADVCREIVRVLQRQTFEEAGGDRVGSAAATLGRFGS